MWSLWSGHWEDIVPCTLGDGWLMGMRDSHAYGWEWVGTGYHIGTLDVTLLCLQDACLSLESLSEGKDPMPGL